MEILLILHDEHYDSDSKDYFPIVTTLPPNRLLIIFNYWRTTESCSSQLHNLCDS